MESFRGWRGGVFIVGLLACAGCVRTSHPMAAEPGVSFAAHTSNHGLVVDKMQGAQTGILVAPVGLPSADRPQFVLETGTPPAAALWIDGADTIVRRAPDTTAPTIGRVGASWEQGAIQLTLTPQGNGSFRTTRFVRLSGGTAPAALGQPADTTLDLSGVYRAELLDARGAPAGWLRVRIAANQTPERVYDGVLPEALSGPLAAAAAARLDAEICAVESRALNPHSGN
jgi:hypothetical protein